MPLLCRGAIFIVRWWQNSIEYAEKGFLLLKSLQERFRKYFQEEGFWFPAFQACVKYVNSHFSVCNRLNRRFANGENAPLGVGELYQVLLIIIGVVWLILIDRPLHPIFQTQIFRLFGSIIAAYIIFELFVFSLDWIFVAEDPLESYRRSLATFLFSIIQVSLFFVILFILSACYGSSFDIWESAYTNTFGIISIRLVPLKNEGICSVYSEFQRIIGATLMVIIVASLVGAVIRKERKSDEEELAKLIRKLKSKSHAVASGALAELDATGWLSDGSLRSMYLGGGDLDDGDFTNGDLQGVALPFTSLKRTSWLRCNLENAMLIQSDLEGAIFYLSSLSGDGEEANLKGARLWGANLKGADVRVGQLMEARCLIFATMQDGNPYDGRFNLWGDLENLENSNIEGSSNIAVAYGVSEEHYLEGQDWYREFQRTNPRPDN